MDDCLIDTWFLIIVGWGKWAFSIEGGVTHADPFNSATAKTMLKSFDNNSTHIFMSTVYASCLRQQGDNLIQNSVTLFILSLLVDQDALIGLILIGVCSFFHISKFFFRSAWRILMKSIEYVLKVHYNKCYCTLSESVKRWYNHVKKYPSMLFIETANLLGNELR